FLASATYGSFSWRCSQRWDETVRPRAVFTRTVARRPVGLLVFRVTAAERIGLAVGLAHQVHQHALAQAAIGDPHHGRLPLAAHRLEDGAAGQGEVGALVADAGHVGELDDALLRELVADAQDGIAADARAVDQGAVVALQPEVMGADRRHRARGADHLDL